MNAVVRFFLDVDRKDWAALRAGLTDEVDVDYSSLSGDPAERLPADGLLDRWRGLLPGFDVTQHVLGELVPVGGGAFECNVRAHHRLGDEEWLVAGVYTLTVAGPLISGITLHVSYQAGALDLPARAAARAGSR